MSKVRYLLTIIACRRKTEINEFMIMDVIAWLEDNKVRITTDNTFSDHGTYRQVHWHGIVEFSGRFKGLTRFNWVSGPDDVSPIAFRIHWSKIRGRFGMSNSQLYIKQNTKPSALAEQQRDVDDFYKMIDIKGYPDIY